jgi:hypothetical protein
LEPIRPIGPRPDVEPVRPVVLPPEEREQRRREREERRRRAAQSSGRPPQDGDGPRVDVRA